MRGAVTAVLLTLAVAVPIAFYAGGVTGFGRGFDAALFSESGGAATTVLMLRKLRGGDTKPAVDMLELQLDSQIVQNDVGRKGFESVFNLPRLVGVGDTGTIDRGARAALKYRAEFPSVMPGAARVEVDAALAKLAKLSPVQN